jgi:hypothetical protein
MCSKVSWCVWAQRFDRFLAETIHFILHPVLLKPEILEGFDERILARGCKLHGKAAQLSVYLKA